MRASWIVAWTAGLLWAGLAGAADLAGPAAVWHFDEGQGARAADSSPNGNHGLLKGGAKWADGISGKALDLNGKDAWVEVPASASLDLANFTLAGWFYPRDKGGGVSFSTGTGWLDERLVISFADNFSSLAAVSDGKKYQRLDGMAEVPMTTWLHFALTGDGKRLTFYVNGVRCAEAAQTVTPATKGVAFAIGRTQGLGTSYFNGLIDDVSLYNRALSREEILAQSRRFRPGGLPMAEIKDGLVAHWPIQEGQGDTVKDVTGLGNDGRIHGAEWVRCGRGWALRFKAERMDFVDCGNGPCLDLMNQGSIEAWVCLDPMATYGEAGILGKAFGSYLLTRCENDGVWFYCSGGGNNARSILSEGVWRHLVGTFDGKMLRLYVDGQMANEQKSAADHFYAGKTFYLGRRNTDAHYAPGIYYSGLLSEVRVYNRCLSAAEVQEHYWATRVVGVPDLLPRVYYFSREVLAEVGLPGLGRVPPTAFAEAWLTPKGSNASLASGRGEAVGTDGRTSVLLKVGDLKPGDYELHARVTDGKGAVIGEAAAAPVRWPERPSWPGQKPEHKVLNSFVTELLNVAAPAAKRAEEYAFTNPRTGWVFISTTASCGEGAKAEIRVDSEEKPALAHSAPGSTTAEAFRRLPEGEHRLHVQVAAGARLERLVVRSVPELILYPGYLRTDVTLGNLDRAALSKDVLPNLNATGGSDPWWVEQRRRRVDSMDVPMGKEGKGPTIEEVCQHWANALKEQRPDVLTLDEFAPGDRPYYPAVTEAVRRIAADPQFKDRELRAYCGSTMLKADPSRQFVAALFELGYTVSWEVYQYEKPTAAEMRGDIDAAILRPMHFWQAALPGAERKIIVNLGALLTPPETTDWRADVDYKVLTDLQYHAMANDPAFLGLAGIEQYGLGDRDLLFWIGRLRRHYCIEGKSSLLSQEYGYTYRLLHLVNPDFEQGLEGWTLRAAEPDSMAAKVYAGFGTLQGRYPDSSQGDAFLWARRSAKAPNSFSQTATGLTPGKLYSLKMYSSDYGELLAGKSKERKNAVTINVEGADLVPALGFDYVYYQRYHAIPPFDNDKNRYWLNYHQRVFRAKGAEAKLTVSDWSSDDAPGGPVGQELMFNFLELQPYYTPE